MKVAVVGLIRKVSNGVILLEAYELLIRSIPSIPVTNNAETTSKGELT
jgi:hypothetical protein